LSSVHASEKKLVFLVFVFFLLINILSSGGHLDSWDGIEAFLVTETMVTNHTAMLDPSVPSVRALNFNLNYTIFNSTASNLGNYSDPQKMTLEPVYTVRSLILSAAAVPFYYSALVFSESPVVFVGLFVNSLFISLTAVVIFCISSEIQRSKRIGFIMSLIYSVCTFVWPYNTTFWVQPLQGLLLVVPIYLLILTRHNDRSFLCHFSVLSNKRTGSLLAGLAGLSLGLAVFAHPTSLLSVPAVLVYAFFSVMRHQKWNFIYFLVTLVAVLFFTGLVNYVRFGSFVEFGYGYFSSLAVHNGWSGLLGLIISPGSGLIFYFPLAIMLPLGAKYMYKDNKALFFLCVYIIVANWIYYGTLSYGYEPGSWSGGAWGPRYLVPVLPFMIILLGSIFPRIRKGYFMKSVVVGLCLAGFYINLSGLLIWVQYGVMYGLSVEGLYLYPNYLDIMTWSPMYSPIILHTKALITDYVSTVTPEQYENTSWHWAAYGNAPCKYDLYIYCNLGVVPFLAIVSIFILIALLVTYRIRVFPFLPIKRLLNSVKHLRRTSPNNTFIAS
jgi:hypothetical protein